MAHNAKWRLLNCFQIWDISVVTIVSVPLIISINLLFMVTSRYVSLCIFYFATSCGVCAGVYCFVVKFCGKYRLIRIYNSVVVFCLFVNLLSDELLYQLFNYLLLLLLLISCKISDKLQVKCYHCKKTGVC